MKVAKKSLNRFALSIKTLEIVEGEKFLGRIYTKDGRTFHIIKGDKVIVVRRKKILIPT